MKKITLKELEDIYNKIENWKKSDKETGPESYLGMTLEELNDFVTWQDKYELDIDLEDSDEFVLEELENYIGLEGSEIGEVTELLVGLWARRGSISEELKRELQSEIVKYYLDFKYNTEIVEREDVITRTVKELIWKQ